MSWGFLGAPRVCGQELATGHLCLLDHGGVIVCALPMSAIPSLLPSSLACYFPSLPALRSLVEARPPICGHASLCHNFRWCVVDNADVQPL